MDVATESKNGVLATQANELGPLYLPEYVALVPLAVLTAAESNVLGPLTGHRVLGIHDAHLMEFNANLRAGLGNTSR